MKKFLIIFFVVLAEVCAGQPSITWMRLYDTPYHMDDYASKIISADSGNLYIIGRVSRPVPPYGAANVLKIDSYGKVIWNNIFDTIFHSQNSGALTPDGGCVTVGGGSRFVKVSREGSLVWDKMFNTIPVQLKDVIRTEDSGYVACGFINNIRKDGYIVKIDSAGNFQWDKIIYATDWIMLYSIVNGIDSGYVVTGFTNDILPSRAVLYEMSNNGLLEDTRTYNIENGYTIGISIKRFNNGYLLGGYSGGFSYLMMLNKDLDSTNILKFLKPPNIQTFQLMDICVINNNKIVLVSEFDSTENHFDYSKILFTDTLGNILRNRNFYSLHPLGFVKLMSLLPLADGGIVSAGYSDYYGKDNNDDYIAVRTDSLLNSPTVGISEHNEFLPKNFILYQNYPNPFNPKTSIEFYTPKKAMIVLEIFDINGRKIFDLYKSQTNSGSYKVSWDASSYASGIYFVTMTADNTRVYSRKIVLLK